MLPQVLSLDRLCLGGLWSEAGYRREFDSPNSDLLALWYQEDPMVQAQLLGFVCLWAIVEEAHITLLAVHPRYRRQGMGQALLWAALQSAHDRGLERATLEVEADNLPAQQLYKKFGFREIGRRRNYYPKTGGDAIILWNNRLHKPDFATLLEKWYQTADAQLASAAWQLTPLLHKRS